MNHDYERLAYEVGVLRTLIQLGKSNLLKMEGDGTPKVEVYCENLSLSKAKAPEESILFVLNKLERMVRSREMELGRFSMVRLDYDEDEKVSQGSGSQAEARTEAGKGKAKDRRGPG